MRYKIIARYRIVTPMFIGDANQEASSISPNSVKGALRFWWRALNWGNMLKENQNNEVAALQALHRKETELFGGLPETVKNEQTGKDETEGGQGVFLLRVETENLKILSPHELDDSKDYSLKTHRWHSYLLGLGLMEYREYEKDKKANFYLRSAIVRGSFTVQLYCKPCSSDPSKKREQLKQLSELKNLLLLWGLLGGLGSRQRKGFGSISITELKIGDKLIELPQNQPEVLDTLKKLIDKSATTEPTFTAFSQSSQILCSPAKTQTAWQALAEIAEEMQMFRGWGYSHNGGQHRINGEIANHDAHTHKRTDHNIVYDYSKPTVLTKQLPKNYVFGLPRSYTLSIPQKNGEQKPKRIEFKLDVLAHDKAKKEDKVNKRSRRAAPVFIHVHQFPNNDKDSMIIQSFLPATFLPQQDIVQIKQKIKLSNNETEWRGIDDITVDAKTNWLVIDEYFKGFSEWSPVWKELI